jgi:16S rRNA (uracil1498-N3)-methyltransferase
MRLHRFYVPIDIEEKGEITLSEYSLIHQLKNVFRFNVGTRVILFNNSGFEYEGMITLLKNNEARVLIDKATDKRNVTQKEVWLFAALIKKDNFEWIIEKATELGVSHIVPVISERSEKKSLNLERGNKILIEASEQSGRVILPTLKEPRTLSDVIQDVTQGRLNKNEEKMKLFLIDPRGESVLHTKGFTEQNIGIFIGPEGGWTERELELFKESDIEICNIGSQILRAETAAVAVSALLLLG